MEESWVSAIKWHVSIYPVKTTNSLLHHLPHGTKLESDETQWGCQWYQQNMDLQRKEVTVKSRESLVCL